MKRLLALCTVLLLALAAGVAQDAAPLTAASWLGDAGHFLLGDFPLYANNPDGKAFTVTVHRHIWKFSGGTNQGDYAIRVLAPDGAVKATGTIPSGDASTLLQVPAGTKGVYKIDYRGAGYPLTWVECSLPQMVAESRFWQGESWPRGLFQLHAMTPRRWYFYVPAGTRKFQIRHVIGEGQTHREDYGFFVMNPRGQRVEALFGGKPLDMSPTAGIRSGFTLPLASVPITRTIEVDPGTDGRFWSVWATGGDSHNYSDLSMMLDGVPSYFASSPEQWFDPRTGETPPRRLYDEAVIRVPDTVDASGKASPPYPRYFCSPSPFLGDEDYNSWRGPHTVWLFNPENRPIEFGVQSYLLASEDQAKPVAVKVTGPRQNVLAQQALALEKSLVIPAAGAGVYQVECDGAHWFPWTHPASPIVMQGQPLADGSARFALETGVARHWYFLVPPGTKQFTVAVTVRDPLNVLRVEVHAPDRLQEEMAVRGGARREMVVPVDPQLAGRLWFLRTEIGSATRFTSGKGNPRQVNIEADLELRGVPGYLAPTWEQWFDPAKPGHPFAVTPKPASWEARASLPLPRHDLQLIAAQGKLIAISGAGDQTVPNVDCYDPVKNAWSPLAPIPDKRGWFGAAMIGGKIYCIGGKRIRSEQEKKDSGDPRQYEYRPSLNIYDPAVDRWTVGPPMRAPRAGCAAAALDGKLYVIGGSEQGNGFLNRVEIYDPATNTWQEGPPIPDGREDLGAAAVGGKIYVIGGVRHSLRSDVYIFNPRTGTWTAGAPMPTPRRSFAVAVDGPRIWCIGGVGDRGFVSTVEVYDTSTNRWATGLPHPQAKAWMGAAVLDGRLYTVGGADYNADKKLFNWLGDVYVLPLSLE